MDKEFSNIIPATGLCSDEVSFADTVFGFWEDFQDSPQNSSTSGAEDPELYDDHEDDSFSTVEKDQAFWEEQEQLLKVQYNHFRLY